MQVRFLIDQKSTGDKKLVVGWTVLPPGAKHDRHRHHNCDEFFIVVKGRGMSYRARNPPGKAMLSILRAAHGTDSITPPARRWFWFGAGVARARSKRRATKFIRM
jgi:oxalate decarboxylase/phosphoglucose isomerase-like protein (cupin superfamily)